MAFNGTFSKLSIPERQALLDSGERRRFADGDVIIRQGTLIDGIFVVTAGEVRVEHGFRVVRKAVVKQADGSQQDQTINGRLSVEVTRLGRGAIFGEMSFVDESPTSASVAAVGEVETSYIPKERVREKLERDSGFAQRFFHSLAAILSKRLREANQRARGGRPTPAAARSAAASEMGLALPDESARDELPPLPPQTSMPSVEEARMVANTAPASGLAPAAKRVAARVVRKAAPATQPAQPAQPVRRPAAQPAQSAPAAAARVVRRPAAQPAQPAQPVRRPAAQPAQPAQPVRRPAAQPARPAQPGQPASAAAAKVVRRPAAQPAQPAQPTPTAAARVIRRPAAPPAATPPKRPAQPASGPAPRPSPTRPRQ
jgi:CRP/FNR family transcriptional regulator, cyclic AMP receptor protein